MENSGGIASKSSNEILNELFGAFNVEPPNVVEKPKSSSSEADDSERSKKMKKSKRKKSKKKHKSKKRKRKHSNTDSGRESDSSVNKLKKKKKKNKEKKSKKNGRVSSPTGVSYELPVNQVPMALDIILDGTVGIKGEDGVIPKIPDVHDVEKDIKDSENIVNGVLTDSVACENEDVKNVEDEGTENKPVNVSKVPVVFDVEPLENSEKQKKGKIQIRNLKFSSVYHETVKAVEEKQKKQEEKKAEIEEGELSDSSDSDGQLACDVSGDGLKTEKRTDDVERRYSSHSKMYHDREELRIHVKKKSSKSRHSSRSRSRSRSASHSRSRSRHRSRSRYYSHDRISHKRARSRSRDYYSHYHSDNHRKRSRISPSSSRQSHSSSSRDRRRERSRSRRSRERKEKVESSHKSGSRDRSKTKSEERTGSIEKIDKEKLLAIARKNALKLIDAGVVPGGDKLTALKAGGKTVNELTEYCKKLSKKEALEKDVSDIESETSDEGEKPFHHPFQVRDRPNSIIMNIKNSIPLPVKSLQEKAAEQSKQLRLQFPVSSGSSHRRTENEWVPVIPKKEEPAEKQGAVSQPAVPASMSFAAPLSTEPPQARVPERYPMLPVTEFSAVPPPQPFNRPVFPVIQPNPQPVPRLDISSIVSKRLEAMRKLQENPNDVQALNEMYNAQQEMQYWAESKQEPGAFTGTTGVKILTASELSSGVHAWAKRNQLVAASPVRGGMGMTLLQKMGWQPGEGLGKNKEGTLEPLRLEVKMDKKGLVASDESQRGRKGGMVQSGSVLPTVKTLDGKHPVSLLNEYCSRRRYEAPCFELCFECGPDHKKNFLFKVKVNGVEYTPTIASPNKKMAKAEAAAICLKSLGVISNTS